MKPTSTNTTDRAGSRSRYHNETFENIPDEKRRRILHVAVAELASAGLGGARMKDIAAGAGVAYGSMYNYFPTRDDMIRTIIQEGRRLQAEVFGEAAAAGAPFFARLEAMIERIQRLAADHPAMIAVWVELSHAHAARFTDEVLDLEADGARFWLELVRQGVDSGELAADTDVGGAAFLIDTLLSALLKANISEVQRDRLRMFFAPEDATPDATRDDEGVRAALMKTLRRALL